jgi:hypothetical protein
MELNVDQRKRIEKVAYASFGKAIGSTIGGVGRGTSTVVDKPLNVIGSMISRSAKNVTPARLTTGKGLPKAGTNKNISDALTSTSTSQNANQNYGLSKNANQHGEPMTNNIVNYYRQGAIDALEKVAQIPAMMPPQQMDPAMMQQQQMMDPAMMQQQIPPNPMMQPAAPAEPMVGGDMGEVQQQMAAQATPEELQQVQNSGITPGDIASAAKVIQTMAEMKANADMAGMQPIDQSGVQAPQ